MSDTPRYYQNDRGDMLPVLPNFYSRVLEVGCGEGNFRENLSLKHEYWGIEPVKSACMNAVKKLDRALNGTYEETCDQVPDHSFDLIICNDVIEHMDDYNRFLQSIKSKMKSGGCLVASIPNVRYLGNLSELLIRKDWQYKDEGILDRTHLRFFTQKSIYRMLAANGYEVEQFIGINPYWNNSRIRHYLAQVAILLLGEDTRFLQFAVRIKCVE